MTNNNFDNNSDRPKLSDVFKNSAIDALKEAWDTTPAAAEFEPLPKGTYIARIIKGEPGESRNGTPKYTLTFKVIEGEYAGRQFWHDLWLTPAGLPMTRRDAAKIGITKPDQFQQPLTAKWLCKVRLAQRELNDGYNFNRVQSFEVIGRDTMEDEDFPPSPQTPSGNNPAATSDSANSVAPDQITTKEIK